MKSLAAALKHSYKAAAFDVDGTLTPFARWIVPDSLKEALRSIPINIPLAICSGRSFDYARTKLEHILDGQFLDEAQKRRWFLICENGGVLYRYNARKKDYEMVFEVPWPDQELTQETMEAFIRDKFGWHVQFVLRPHSLVVRFHDWLYVFPRLVSIVSHRTGNQIRTLFKKMGHDKHFMVEDSGIGNLIIPAASGKGKAIEKWAKHLGIAVQDILVVGDQAQPGGNDEELLSGNYGVPFSVGKLTKSNHPFPVLDPKGRHLKGPEGTEYLLRKVFSLDQDLPPTKPRD
ncbi:MAG: HAD family hydrolase [Candidatus Gracilibacteria bacterium]|jgi:HAD superfamily hydrolase (TIGR01484 family)